MEEFVRFSNSYVGLELGLLLGGLFFLVAWLIAKDD